MYVPSKENTIHVFERWGVEGGKGGGGVSDLASVSTFLLHEFDFRTLQTMS